MTNDQNTANSSIWAPTEFSSLSNNPDLKHEILLNLPMPTSLSAQQLYRIISVDRELKPNESSVKYKINQDSPNLLQIKILSKTIRQLRLTVNNLLDNISLIIETMEAFMPESQRDDFVKADSLNSLKKQISDNQQTIPDDPEFELNGTGRAG